MSTSHPTPPNPGRPSAAASAPVPVGLARSFGFGDRIGLATPGHLAAVRRFAITPVLVQHAPRDLARAGTPPFSVVEAAARTTQAAAFTRAWAADANGVKTEADIEALAAGGFTWFTLDPSAFIENRADSLDAAALAEELAILGKEGVLPAGWIAAQAGRRHELDGAEPLAPDLDALARAAVKFSRALHHAQRLARHVSRHARHHPADLELALVECAAPTSAVEHLFVALEARRRGLPLTALALRWHAGIEPGTGFAGDVSGLEAAMRTHAAVARTFGPYKVSVHHAGGSVAILPALARACRDPLHVKTSGASFLAALRLVCRTAPDLFREIAAFARVRFEAERVPHLVSTRQADVDRLFRGPALAMLEQSFLDTPAGRQLLDTTAGSILHAGLTSRGRPFRDAILELLMLRRDDHVALLDEVFTQHLAALNEG